MKKRKTPPKAVIADRYVAEARRLAGTSSDNEIRFLRVAAAREKHLEPAGRLAG